MTAPVERVSRASGFDLLRVLAAALVIFSHSYALTGRREPVAVPWPGEEAFSWGHLGLQIFFVISGCLVLQSWQRDPVWRRFLARRLARLLPGLVVALLLTVLVVGPAVSLLAPGRYFGDLATVQYLVGNALLYAVQYDLPGVFSELPLTAVNGSLWTLRIEFTAYVLLLVLGLVGLLRRGAVLWSLVLLSAVASALVGYGVVSTPEYVAVFPVHDTLELLTFFAAGAALGRPRRLIVEDRWWAVPLALAVYALGFVLDFSLVQYMCLPYVVVWVGRRQLRLGHLLQRTGDPSYGMYVYGFLLQQLLLLGAPAMPLPAFIGASLLLATGAGYASWHLVERRALNAVRARLDRSPPSGPQARSTVSPSAALR